ncbi:hypothetical protein WJX77_008185 [Trebouxia sp. C0004]
MTHQACPALYVTGIAGTQKKHKAAAKAGSTGVAESAEDVLNLLPNRARGTPQKSSNAANGAGNRVIT